MESEKTKIREVAEARSHWPVLAMVALAATLATLLALVTASAAPAASIPTLQYNCDYFSRDTVDPIMDPPAGRADIHDFYGNKSVNANSTYSSLRTNKATTCKIAAGTASYWHPAFMEGGKVQTPTAITNYYRDMGKRSPNMRPIPKGLQMIANKRNGNVKYKCGKGKAQSTPPVGCTKDWRVMFQFPNCWNKKGKGPGSVRYSPRKCPRSHPYEFPELQMAVKFPRPADGRLDAPVKVAISGEWRLATKFAHADRFDADQVPRFNRKWLKPCVLDVKPNKSSPRFCRNAKG